MNKKIIFKWNRESVGRCIWKNRYVKSKYHCSLFTVQTIEKHKEVAEDALESKQKMKQSKNLKQGKN